MSSSYENPSSKRIYQIATSKLHRVTYGKRQRYIFHDFGIIIRLCVAHVAHSGRKASFLDSNPGLE